MRQKSAVSSLLLLMLPFMLMLLLALPATASASAKGIWAHQNIVVPKGETVTDVYVVGGDADIYGQVEGSVIVVNGSAHIESSAHIEGFILVIGGNVVQDPGAVIADDIYSFSFDNATLNSLLAGSGMVLGLWTVQLGASLLMIIAPVLICLLGKRKASALIDRFEPFMTGRMLYAGLLSGVILAAAGILLMLSIIGIPLLLVIAVLFIAAFMIGLTVVSRRLGETLRWADGRADWIKSLAGAIMLTGIANIPLLGMLLLLALTLLALGICTQWLAETRSRRRNKRNNGA